jgi:DME family drug/metabolite transporter
LPRPFPRTASRASHVDPRLLVVGAAVLWGTTGTARALGPDDASPTAVGAVRLVVGALCLLALARAGYLRWSGPATPTADPPSAATPAADPTSPATPTAAGHARRAWRAYVPLAPAAVAMAAYQPLFFGGVARTGVAVGTVVGIGSSPVFAGVLGMVARGERPGGRWLAATALALAGTALLVGTSGGGGGGGGAGGDDVDPAGIGLALGAGLAYAVYVLASKLALDRGWAPDAATLVVFGVAGVLLVPVASAAGVTPLLAPGGLLMVAHLGVITVAVAYLLFGRGLRGVGVGAAGTLTLAEPATAATLGVVVLGERPGAATAAGVGLIVAGLVALAARRSG